MYKAVSKPRYDIPDLMIAIETLEDLPIWFYPWHDRKVGYIIHEGKKLDFATLQVTNHDLFGFSLPQGKSKQCWTAVAKDRPRWQYREQMGVLDTRSPRVYEEQTRSFEFTFTELDKRFSREG